MQTVVVTTTDELWKAAQETGEYTQSTIDSKLDDVGFIHATTPDQVVPMLNRHFSNRNDILLLLADLEKVRPEIKFEAPLSGRSELFPHIYGALNVDAVYTTVRPTKDSTGNFVTPEVLTERTP